MAISITDKMRALAERHRVRWSVTDDGGEFIIQGRRGDNHIFDPYEPGHLALCVIESSKQVQSRSYRPSSYWVRRIAREHPDWEITQGGPYKAGLSTQWSTEAVFVFPITEANFKAALIFANVRRKRRDSAAAIERLRNMGAAHRFRPGHAGATGRPGEPESTNAQREGKT